MSKRTNSNRSQQQADDEDCFDRADLFIEDVYWDGEPLTLERRRELGLPTTAEEVFARMDAEARKQADSAA